MLQDRRAELRAAVQAPDGTARRGLLAPDDTYVELLPRMPYDTCYTPDTAVIGFAFETQTGTHSFASSRRTPFRARPNGLAYVPQGCDVASTSRDGGEYLRIETTLRSSDDLSASRRFSDLTSPAAIESAQELRAALLSGGYVDPLVLEGCVSTLRSVVEGVLAGREANPRAGRWMTARRLKLIDDIIEERMGGALTVGEIASTLGLSQGFLSRAFKAAVGKTPHEYIVDRRVARARRLLQNSTQGLAAIAAASGFSSHAHMTTQFRRRLGITPSRLRGAGRDLAQLAELGRPD
jgi:AraC family transcriptional regulator